MTGAYYSLDAWIAHVVAEDLESGDITSSATVPGDLSGRGSITAKATGVLAGTDVATRIFRHLSPDLYVTWHAADGDPVSPGMLVATINGPARALLAAERTALNILQRMSGIASLTAAFVRAIDGTGATILDTRKTAPGMRALDKHAVRSGGGQNHRYGLWDMYLIKENHIAAAGSIHAALDGALAHRAGDTRRIDPKIEIEVTSLGELDEVLEHGGADRVMLDNFAQPSAGGVDTSLLAAAVKRVAGRLETEASGNVDLMTVRPIAETGVQFISVGALTHSVTALDLSLVIRSA